MKELLTKHKRTFLVSGRVTVSAWVEVEAESEHEALGMAPVVAGESGFETDQDGEPEWVEAREKNNVR